MFFIIIKDTESSEKFLYSRDKAENQNWTGRGHRVLSWHWIKTATIL